MIHKVIFLDWDGTLSVSRFWEHWQRIDPGAYALLQEHLFIGQPELIHDWMRGAVSSEQAIALVADTVGVSSARMLEELEESCRAMRFVDDCIPGCIEALRQQGAKVVIATDNMDSFYRWTIPSLRLNDMFDDVLDSARMRAMKKEVDASGRSTFSTSIYAKTTSDRAKAYS